VNFFAHQDIARRNTKWLIAYFVAAVIAIIVAVYVAFMAVLSLSVTDKGQSFSFLTWDPSIFFSVAGVVVVIIAAGSLYEILRLSDNGAVVAEQLGGHKILPNTRNLRERVLLNVVEEMAIASGTPVPEVFLLADEGGINAFAAGTTPQNAVIGVTRGCLEALKRDELQAIVAHEFSHILNGDMRMNLRMMGLLHGIMLLAMIGYELISNLGGRSSRRSKDSGQAMLMILAMGVLLMVIGYIGVLFARLIQAAVSRQREFLADASAVQFTRNPGAIADALKRIGGWMDRSTVETVRAKEACHMFFAEGLGRDWFATHPPLDERIRRIDSKFTGRFETTKKVEYTEADVVDRRLFKLAGAGSTGRLVSSAVAFGGGETSGASAHKIAKDAAGSFSKKPTDALSHVGNPAEEHVQQANRILSEIDEDLQDEARDPMGAMAVICGLLMTHSAEDVLEKQKQMIQSAGPQGLIDGVILLLPKLKSLKPEARLPLVCLASPAIGQLSSQQKSSFTKLVNDLIEADSGWNIFEFVLQRYITGRILAVRPNTPSPRLTKESVRSAFADILSALAHFGGDHAADCYRAGWDAYEMNGRRLPLRSVSECSPKNLDASLDVLGKAGFSEAQRMLRGFCTCISHDRKTTIIELELIRVISDSLGCPMPPILPAAN